MTRPACKEYDCTNALPVSFAYDRMTELGVRYDNPRWRAYGAKRFFINLVLFGKYLDSLGCFGLFDKPKIIIKPNELNPKLLPEGYAENVPTRTKVAYVLTGGLYVNKPGAHGKGIGGDHDGFEMENGDVYLYKQGVDYVTEGGVHIRSLYPDIACRVAAAYSLYFGVVITWGYNARHLDHIHFDMTLPVGWREPGTRKTSQVVLLQEILVHCFGCTGLKIDGIFGSQTIKAWIKSVDKISNPNIAMARWKTYMTTPHWTNDLWLRTLRLTAEGKYNKGGRPL